MDRVLRGVQHGNAPLSLVISAKRAALQQRSRTVQVNLIGLCKIELVPRDLLRLLPERRCKLFDTRLKLRLAPLATEEYILR